MLRRYLSNLIYNEGMSKLPWSLVTLTCFSEVSSLYKNKGRKDFFIPTQTMSKTSSYQNILRT